MKNEGHIREDVYERMGFLSDTNYDGDEVDKPDNISQESRHRAKILSNDLQCDLRRRKVDNLLAVERRNVNNELIKQNSIHKENTKAMGELFPDREHNLKDLPI